MNMSGLPYRGHPMYLYYPSCGISWEIFSATQVFFDMLSFEAKSEESAEEKDDRTAKEGEQLIDC